MKVRAFLLCCAVLAALSDAAAAQIPAVLSKDVDIPTIGGATLAATYYSPQQRGPAVIIFRNCDQRRASVDAFARNLSARGIHVVAFDYRESSAPPGFDWRTGRTEDGNQILRWLAAQLHADTSRIGAVGGSCGVQIATDFGARHARTVRAVAVLSSPPIEAATLAFFDRTPSIAVLAVASAAENSVPNLDPLVKASPNPASRLIVLPSGHGTEMLKVTSLERTVIDWLSEQLRR